MKYLTLGSCLKNEDSYMQDFIAYHRKVGVDHFVFFDREYNSLNSLIGNEPDVEIIHFPEMKGNNHQEAFGQLIKYNQGKTKWLALIDADQALVPVKYNNVKEILKEYEDYASLQCNWKAFGSNGELKRNVGSVYERFTKCARINSKYSLPTQFICQPDRVLPIKVEEPHYPQLPVGEISVNTNKEEIDSKKIVAMNPKTPKTFQVPALYDVMWVAHYTNKSYEEFLIKNARGRADILGSKIHLNQFNEYDNECIEEETKVLEIWNE
jgi:hypothetical protein